MLLLKMACTNLSISPRKPAATRSKSFRAIPRGWMAKPLTEESVDLFKKTRKLTKLSPVLIHTNYLINLAAADEALLLKSIASFREEVERAILLGVDYLVLHPGSARGSCEADAIEICALSLQVACKGLKLGRLRILLENTAGQGECIGHRFEHLQRNYEAVSEAAARRLHRHGAFVYCRL